MNQYMILFLVFVKETKSNTFIVLKIIRKPVQSVNRPKNSPWPYLNEIPPHFIHGVKTKEYDVIVVNVFHPWFYTKVNLIHKGVTGASYTTPLAWPVPGFQIVECRRKFTRQKNVSTLLSFFPLVSPAYDLACPPPSELLFERLKPSSFLSVSPDQLWRNVVYKRNFTNVDECTSSAQDRMQASELGSLIYERRTTDFSVLVVNRVFIFYQNHHCIRSPWVMNMMLTFVIWVVLSI